MWNGWQPRHCACITAKPEVWTAGPVRVIRLTRNFPNRHDPIGTRDLELQPVDQRLSLINHGLCSGRSGNIIRDESASASEFSCKISDSSAMLGR